MNMADKTFHDVTLAFADISLLQCWEEKVRQGAECSLILKHSKGRTITILKSSSQRILKPKDPSALPPLPPISSQAEKKRKKRGTRKKRLEALISFQERLVKEKGLPPSRMMLERASAAAAEKSSPLCQADIEEESTSSFKCDGCEFTSYSKLGVSKHKEHCKSKVLIEAEDSNLEKVNEDVNHDEETPPSKFSCPSCLTTFLTEHSLSRHIYTVLLNEGKGAHYPSNWTGCDVKCRICEHISSSCAAMVEHVENEHKRTSSIIPKLKKHYSGWLVAESDKCNLYCRKLSSLG